MRVFYTRLDQFLFTIGLEEYTKSVGCTDAEIAVQEHIYGVEFPLAYRLFLKWYGHTRLKSVEQDLQVDFLEYYWESAHALLAANQDTLEPNGFVFSEWQGYSFHYFLLGSDNPPVRVCTIVSDTELGLEYIDCGRFTDWLIGHIKSVIRHRLGETSVQLPAAWRELDQIAKLADLE